MLTMMAVPDVSGPSIDGPGLAALIWDERRDALVLLGQAGIDFVVAHPVVAAPLIVILVIRRRRQLARVLSRIGGAMLSAWLDR